MPIAASERTEIKSLRRGIQRNVRGMAVVCSLCWVLGVAVFGVVERMHTDVTHETDASLPSHAHFLVLAAAGGGTYVTGVAGYWGALHLEHGMVCVFSYIVFVSAVIEMSVGAITLTFSGKAVEQDTMTYVNNSVNEDDDFIFNVQKQLECCGSESSADWVESAWWKGERKRGSSRVVPHSCCRDQDLRHKKCQEGSSPYKKVSNPKLIFREGCHSMAVARRRGLLLSSGSVCCVCGIVKLAAFFAIHYFANVILIKQQRLEELRGRLTSSVRSQNIEKAESHYHRRLSVLNEA